MVSYINTDKTAHIFKIYIYSIFCWKALLLIKTIGAELKGVLSH